MNDTLSGESRDIAADNRARLKALFPSVFTETVNDQGEVVESVDFEKLKAELGTCTVLFEKHNLINLTNEFFGEECQKNLIVIRRGIKNVQAQFDTIDSFNHGHEYVLFYSKQSSFRFEKFYVPYNSYLEDVEMEIEGSWNNHWRGTNRPTMSYEIFGIKPQTGQWRWSEVSSKDAITNWENLCSDLGLNPNQKLIDNWVEEKEHSLGKKTDLLLLSHNNKPEHYVRPTDGKLASDLWVDIKPNGSSQLKNIMGKKYFDSPKSIELLSRLIEFGSDTDIILDFFSGSATTAHAVLDLNKQDGGNRKFIMVQLPEPCAEDSDAYKVGFKTIADIGKERIRRVINKLNDEQESELDLEGASEQDRGFKVFRLDQSNFKQWRKLTPDDTPEEIEKQLELHIDHIDHQATADDLLYEILIKAGYMPTKKIETIQFAGIPVFSVDNNELLICLADVVTRELIDAVVAANPLRFICLDAAFGGNDQLKANAVQTFAAHNLGKEKQSQIVFRTV